MCIVPCFTTCALCHILQYVHCALFYNMCIVPCFTTCALCLVLQHVQSALFFNMSNLTCFTTCAICLVLQHVQSALFFNMCNLPCFTTCVICLVSRFTILRHLQIWINDTFSDNYILFCYFKTWRFIFKNYTDSNLDFLLFHLCPNLTLCHVCNTRTVWNLRPLLLHFKTIPYHVACDVVHSNLYFYLLVFALSSPFFILNFTIWSNVHAV